MLQQLELAPATIVGYSMGGAIAQLVARHHPEVASGVVLSATAQHWKNRRSQRSFKAMGAMGLALSVAPRTLWRAGLGRSGMKESQTMVWLHSELLRHSARDIVEAGRELGRFDSRGWLPSVSPEVAVVITTKDELVPPTRQRQLAEAAGGPVFEAACNHMEVISRARVYNPALLQGIASVTGTRQATAA